jgi:hypothetical protein
VTGRTPAGGGDVRAALEAARTALRAELEARGHAVASDTLGLRRELYLKGDGDLARALFEFMPSAEEACDRMYQGSWVEGLPPRFAVLPASEAGAPALEMLEQMRVRVLLFDQGAAGVVFRDLDEALEGVG